MEMNVSCPLPLPANERIVLAHGGGGRLTQQLLEDIFYPAFAAPELAARHDGALLAAAGRLAFTTDSYVVRPLVFPGGNIGHLAVHGTVNDLAMCGARPLALSASFILEEGLPLALLRDIVSSMADAARAVPVRIVTGDTKVVDKGKGDGVFITTSGVGVLETPLTIAPASVQPGDAILVSGELGAHGIAILSVREGLEFDAPIASDTAPLWAPVAALLEASLEIHCLRDLTRGGLSSALNEIAAARGVAMLVEESEIPVFPAVRGACELLGLDPLYVANEGRFLVILPARQASAALEILRRFPVSAHARLIGEVQPEGKPLVMLRSAVGGRRVLDMLSGEQLPRIC